MQFKFTSAGLAGVAMLSFSPIQASPATATGVMLTATLAGPNEVPGPGDADGTGSFAARVDPALGKLCYTLANTNLPKPTMAHVHSGKMGTAGPPVVTLQTDAPNEVCMAIAKDVALKFIEAPEDYYVNIHTNEHPAGAIRGQLMKP